MWQQAACIDPGACGLIDHDPRLGFGSGGQGRFGAWFDWCLRDQGGLGRKTERIDRGEQLPAFGVLLLQPGVLLPQLIGFVLDQHYGSSFLRISLKTSACNSKG